MSRASNCPVLIRIVERRLMGWTGCFPRGAALDCTVSTGEVAHIAVPPLASIGIDIGKEVFHLVGFGTDGKIALRHKIKRLTASRQWLLRAPTSRPSDDVTNGSGARELPFACALLIRRVIAQTTPLERLRKVYP